MEFNKCSRCGNFFISKDDVCPNCKAKDNIEYESFKTYVETNGFDNDVNTLSLQTGISEKNINRYINYAGYKDIKL